MRNQRSNFIPVPTKPAKSAPKPLPRVLAQRKSSSCQTERVVLIKEENLTFYPCARFGQNDGGMRRDYVKAINYINSCHKFINTLIEKNADNKTAVFHLPMVTNFVPIFSYLIGKKAAKPKEKAAVEKVPEKKSPKNEERKSKSSFAVKKVPGNAPIDPLPGKMGDCEKNVQDANEEKYANQVADIIKEQIQQFLNNLHNDIDKATKKNKSDPPKQKCKNLDIVKQRLEELSKICFLQKNMESNTRIVEMVETPKPPPLPPTPPPINTSEDCSVILSDTEEEVKTESPALRITCYQESATSLGSQSSDIKSDSDLEINTT
ncbi:uncharacterized protein LOC135132734 isoform X1 [Zophobas morio]|uniref:uncharacterized protein LOC135132734 isoform X1 n=1 Tax=Zophobas morio TaxID=2755281 RepID=UPI00308397D8